MKNNDCIHTEMKWHLRRENQVEEYFPVLVSYLFLCLKQPIHLEIQVKVPLLNSFKNFVCIIARENV